MNSMTFTCAKLRPARQCPIRPLVLLLLLMLFGCGVENTGRQSHTPYGGTLYFGVETPFYGLDVLGSGAGGILLADMVILNNLIQEPLFRMNRSGDLIPVLGLSASPSPDGKRWTILLRNGVRFHDGTPFTADAVVSHWNRMLDPVNRFRGRKLFEPIRTVEKTGDLSVCFVLKHPWPAFLNVISDELYISSFIPSPRAVAEGTHDQKPVGTGPFRHRSWNRSDHYVVKKNEDYWQAGKPLLNKVVFRTIPDHQTRYASLMAGELDAIVLDEGLLLGRGNADDVLFLHQSEGSGAEIVLLNTSVPPLDDVRVRRALTMASDQQRHVRMIYGEAVPTVHHPFGEWFRCLDDGYPAYDPEGAKRLIADFGKPVRLECLHTNTSRGRRTGELLQQLYKEIGVTLDLVALSTGPHVMRVGEKAYQLATWRILSANDQGPQLYRSLHSHSETNFAGYRSPVMDQLLEAQRVETDPTKRERLLCRIAALINMEVPFFYRGGRRYNILARRNIRQLTDVSGVRVNLATAWIDEAVKFNALAFDIEKNAAVPEIDCPDPGDVETVMAIIRGTWSGSDDWGATITMTFAEDGTVTGYRTGSNPRTGKYVLCGGKIYMHGSADLEITVAGEQLSGQWKKGEYTGKFILKRSG